MKSHTKLSPSRHACPARRAPRSAYQEEAIKTEHIQIERKGFVFALRENPRGRFLRITEDVRGRHDSIIVPAPGLEHFQRALDQIVKCSAETPPKMPSASGESSHIPPG